MSDIATLAAPTSWSIPMTTPEPLVVISNRLPYAIGRPGAPERRRAGERVGAAVAASLLTSPAAEQRKRLSGKKLERLTGSRTRYKAGGRVV